MLTKKEVDGLHKDKKHKKVPKSFLVELNFSPMKKYVKDEKKSKTRKQEHEGYIDRMFKDENDYSFRQGLTEAEKLYKNGLCTEKEMTQTLRTLDMACYVRVLSSILEEIRRWHLVERRK